ncbi:MAG: ribonuclease HII [Pseudomonadota bacterium]
MLVMGIDEAGRGAVLGPLVLGAYTCDEAALDAVKATGATDSKLLSPARRRALVAPLGALGQGRLELIPATAIDEGNLNDLEMRAMARLIDEVRPGRVWIDAPVNPRGIPRFVRALRACLRSQPELVVEPKADLTWIAVSAASVLAKVRRDAEIEALGPVGSGYPSDPTTRALLTKLLASGAPLPPWVRSRWGTLQRLRQAALFPEQP